MVLIPCVCVSLEPQILPREPPYPPLPCHPQESTCLVGGPVVVFFRPHQEFLLLPPISGWEDRATASPWPLAALSEAKAGACFSGGEQKRVTLLGGAFGWADLSISFPFPDSKCTALLPLLSWDTALAHIVIDWYETIGFPTAFSLCSWWIISYIKIMCKSPLSICRWKEI